MEKTNPHDNAFAVVSFDTDGRIGTEREGLTKREYFAAMAMQSFIIIKSLSTFDCSRNTEGMRGDVAEAATCMADALIEQLNKPINPSQ